MLQGKKIRCDKELYIKKMMNSNFINKLSIWKIIWAAFLIVAFFCSIICIINYNKYSKEITYELSSFHTYDGYTSSINNGYLSIFPVNYEENAGGFCVDSSNTLLSEGDYSVEVSYISDGNNKAYLQAGESVYEELFLPAGEQIISLDFTLNQPVEDARLRIYYNGRGSIHINSMKLKSDKPITSDWIMILALIWIFVAIIFVIRKAYYNNLINKTQIIEMGFVFLISMLSIPYLMLICEGIYWGVDTNIHNMRIEGIKDAIIGGQFPAVIAPSICNSYGSMEPIMYPSTFLYPLAFLRIMNVSPVMVYKFAHIVINILMCSSCYVCVKHITSSIKSSCISLVAFAFSYYHLIMIGSTDWTYGMGIAIIFMFVAILGVYEIFIGDKYSWPYLTIGMWGIMNSHILSALFIVFIIGCLLIVFFNKAINENRIKCFMYAVLATVLICLYRMYTFLDVIINNSLNTGILNLHAYDSWVYSIKGYFIEPISSLSIITFIVGIIFVIIHNEKRNTNYVLLCVFLGINALCFLFMSNVLPWSKMLSVGIFDVIFGYIQFPKRLFQIVIPLSTIIIGIIIEKIENIRGTKIIICLATIVILANSIWSYHAETVKLKGKELAFSGIITGDVLSSPGITDYVPKGVRPDYFDGRTPYYSSEKISIEEGTYEKNGVNISCKVNNQEEEGFIDFPLFAYKGYVCVDDNQKEYKLGTGKNQRLRVHFPKTEKPVQINVTYKVPQVYKIILILSYVSLIVLIVKNKKFFKRTKKTISYFLH